MTVNVRGALGFFAASCCWRSANRPAAMANDSPSRPARTMRVIILSSSTTSSLLDVWDEEPYDYDDGVDDDDGLLQSGDVRGLSSSSPGMQS